MSDRTPHGLVIGKFYPPHEGHHLLVRTAAAASDRVTVLVLAHAVESIPLADRVAWMREVHAGDAHVTVHGVVDDHPVDFEDPTMWDLHLQEFTRGVAEVTDEPVTAVFTSEPYGAELARRLGAIDVPVDPGRGLAPISGTAVRADPVTSWERLAEPARAWFARRVVVLGAESTGTTTLSLALRDALRARGGSHGLTRWVPEHGRDFSIEKLAVDRARAIVAGEPPPAMDELVWRTDEFELIGRRQNALEDDAARLGGPVLVCDTDTFATGIWHERYLGEASPAVDALARRHPLYLLTHHDGVSFEQDGIRDGEGIRAWMTGRFEEALAVTGRRHVVLRGPHEARLEAALDAVDELLTEGWQLADPVTPANASPSL
ncbi:MAG: AAA family ATPase [Acidimicrobiia bacterium]|nr:AAA family ATPase [Acidimicrobiia bacterium]